MTSSVMQPLREAQAGPAATADSISTEPTWEISLEIFSEISSEVDVPLTEEAATVPCAAQI